MEKLKNLFSNIKGKIKKPGTDPTKVWFLFLEIIAVLFVVSAAIHFFIFLDVRTAREKGRTATSTPSSVIIDRGALQDVLGEFDQRKANMGAIKSDASTIKDPSL